MGDGITGQPASERSVKITINIAGPLLVQLHAISARDGDSLDSLVEQALRMLVAEREANPPACSPGEASLKDQGSSPESSHLSLHELILLDYAEREERTLRP